jgi:hypothetical protein
LSAFEDAFARYTPSEKVTTLQAYSRNDFYDFEKVTADERVAFSKPQKPNGHSDCSGVAFSQPPGQMNGLDEADQGPALGPPGDSLDDFT